MPAKTPTSPEPAATTDHPMPARGAIAARNAAGDGLPDGGEYAGELQLYCHTYGGGGDTIDDGDTWSSPYAGRCRGWAWQNGGAVNVVVSYNTTTGVFTFSSAGAGQTGTLYVWARG